MSKWIAARPLLAALAAVSVAIGQTPVPAPTTNPVEFTHVKISVDVNADGTYTQTVDQLILIKSQQGVQAATTALVQYSESLQDGDLLEVYTLKPDGKRIDAPLAQVATRSLPMAVSAPMFDDFKIKALPYQNVAVGDEVGAITRIHQKKPLIPGQFSFVEVFGQTQVVRDLQLVVTAPLTGIHLQTDVTGLDNPPPTVANGKSTWQWTFRNEIPKPPEPGGVEDFDVAPHVVITSFKDYAALAKAYEDGASAKALVTPQVQELADRLTKGTTDRREQARILYEWVSANIKYIAINLGVGAVVPHAANEVLANLYGDCKDHVVLLQALLKAKGIESTAVLIRAGDSFKLAPLATVQQFNHAITYVPEMNLYLDSTARYSPFGVLPFADADKTVLLTAKGKLDHTPWSATSTVFKTVTKLQVLDDGSADAESRVTTSGPLAVSMRGNIANVPGNQEQNFLRQIVGDSGGGSLDRGLPDKLVDPYEFGMHFKLSNYLQMPGPGAIPFTPGPRLFGRLPSIAEVELRPHQRDFICPSGQYVEEYQLQLPASIKVSSVPKPQDLTVGNLKLQTRYKLDGEHGIKATRTVDVVEPHRFCTAERATQLHAEFVKMNGLLGAQALYQ
ncbi:MAG TPA: DUF3857 domain-containing protein [Steroidobacteraceae bacterium]|nr:DUF3857 domain-containing protein [Steroidobacteraceae bacterium]